jgi:short-chain fatty acids transporter
MSEPRLGWLPAIGVAARRGFARLTPEPFAIAVILGALVLVLATVRLGGDGDALRETLGLWHRNGGLWSLLSFGMQASLMLVLGSALADAPLVRAGLSGLARASGGPRRLVGLTALLSCTLALINWPFGLICGAVFARGAGQEAARRGWRVHYPLLCAAGYAGMMVWHGGLSGTAPLKATTLADLREVLGPALAEQVGPIPLTDTLFGPLNLWVTGGLWLLAPLLFTAMTPKGDADATAMSAPRDEPAGCSDDMSQGPASWLDRLERSRLVTWALALPLAVALALHVQAEGLATLDLNTVNLALWLFALVLHGRPDGFLRACDAGVRACTGIILLFPLYGGIMGMLNGSGLSAALAGWFAEAGAGVFTLVTFLSAGLLNLAIPSGGGQWAVQGPVVMAAAQAQGVPAADALLAIAYGDQWTNMLQPFWAAPLLAITGVRARDITGYCALWMLAGGVWIAACLLARA